MRKRTRNYSGMGASKDMSKPPEKKGNEDTYLSAMSGSQGWNDAWHKWIKECNLEKVINMHKLFRDEKEGFAYSIDPRHRRILAKEIHKMLKGEE